ncbi:Retrovirus-related Pol polyprotein from transposon RE2 [Vitis vinifera]|uniref:Retrovirus-related Pol polyprotein from transposon RE2 n=1 Tax=Vitis vinifera TaxID=29760 RepID=A0A438DF76_VITVI|nr:Retrovirus-related Pol polyprotein from transposon RE2 [Vitis vinifera]
MLWHYCTGAMTIPVKGASEEDAAFLSRMIEWDSHNHMILTWIRNTSIPSISNLLGSFDDAKFAWDMLTKRDEFRLYEFLMSLHKDFEPIRGQLLNRSPVPSLDTAVNELVREEARLATLQAQNKLNVLAITPSTPLIEQPQQLVSTSQSSGSTINLSSTELQEIIAQAIRMAGNASLSTALSVLPADGSTMHGNSLGFVSTSTLSVSGDPRMGQELGTGPRVGRMFPVNNLHLPHVAPVFVAAAAAIVSSLPSLALWHSCLGHAPSSRVQQLVSRGTSQQNGRAERKLRHILDTIRALLLLPKFLPHFGVKLVFMLFMQLTAFQVLSSIIRLRMSVSLGHPLTIITFAPLDPLVLFFFSLMSTTNLSLDLDFVVSLVMAKLKRVADEQINNELPHFEPGSPAPALPEDPPQDIPPRHSTRIAMKEELDALTKNHTWDLVTLPPEQSVVGCKWIYKIKTRSDGSVERYKARLVAKGFTQEYGIDYEETFAPVARISSVRALLAVTAARKWDFFQMDVKNVFLNGDLSEEVYMQPPPGLFVESNKLHYFRLGYTASPYDSALFLRRTDKGTILLLLYVDDMIISYFLGLEITHSTDGLYITQAKYASDLLSQAGLIDSKTVDTPVELNVSQYLSAPRSTHYAAVLRILRYLKGTLFHGLFYSAQSPLVLRAFSDADWAGDLLIAEYRAFAGTTSELLWLRWLLKDLGVSTSFATPLYCDNQSAIHIAHNDVFMNGQNTSRLIVILSVIILSMVLLSFSPSPPKINLQISSPSLFLRDALVI